MKFLGKIGLTGMLLLSRELPAFMALILALGLALAAPVQAGIWTPTGSLSTNYGGNGILLSNGKVLVAGGFGEDGDTPMKTAELYNPDTGLWSGTGSLKYARNALCVNVDETPRLW